jgi:hypothetical protein
VGEQAATVCAAPVFHVVFAMHVLAWYVACICCGHGSNHGDTGRKVFKGAFASSPRRTPSNSPRQSNGGGAGALTDSSLSSSASWEQRYRFLTTPVPVSAGLHQCKVVRSKKKDHFIMWLEKTVPGKGKEVEFLMVGKQRKGAKATPNYVLSMDESDHSRQGRGCIGKLRANMATTEYILFDEGLNPALAGNRRLVSFRCRWEGGRSVCCLCATVLSCWCDNKNHNNNHHHQHNNNNNNSNNNNNNNNPPFCSSSSPRRSVGRLRVPTAAPSCVRSCV